MNEALEFHDSLVGSVEYENASLLVAFSSAYIHRSTGHPGIDNGAGYVQTAQLLFGEARATGKLSSCKGRLSDGSVHIQGSALSLIPVPYSASGSIKAELVFENGEVLAIVAKSLQCSSFGEPRFVERYVA